MFCKIMLHLLPGTPLAPTRRRVRRTEADSGSNNPLETLKDMRKTLRPPTKRGIAVIAGEQQLSNSVFKISLRSWQAEYKARRNMAGNADEQKLAQVGNK
jgi:hypothetical protein